MARDSLRLFIVGEFGCTQLKNEALRDLKILPPRKVTKAAMEWRCCPNYSMSHFAAQAEGVVFNHCALRTVCLKKVLPNFT